jgi:hypothetical protein
LTQDKARLNAALFFACALQTCGSSWIDSQDNATQGGLTETSGSRNRNSSLGTNPIKLQSRGQYHQQAGKERSFFFNPFVLHEEPGS